MMDEKTLEIIFTVSALIMGFLMIIFRRPLVRIAYASQLNRAKPKHRKSFDELKKIGLDWLPYKIAEVATLIGGLFFVVGSCSALFFPQVGRYVPAVGELLAFTLFAACGAGMVVFALTPFIIHSIGGRLDENYGDSHRGFRIPSVQETLELARTFRDAKKKDPALRRFQAKLIACVLVVFLFFFVLILLSLYWVIRATT
jgi:hypothetical protein